MSQPSPSPVYRMADEYIRHTGRCVFLTGKAGTGKTTFLRQLRETCHKQMAVAAPTGVAAIHAGGTTLHSLFQLPLTPFIPTDEMRRQLVGSVKMRSERRNVLYALELLVIDEISMVRADVLDAVDTLLRHYKYRPHLPFGGVQVVFIGDMFQLPPVVQDDEWRLLAPYYQGIYFFNSRVFQQVQPVHIELDTVFRQTDNDFIDLLNQVRNNSLTPASLDRLNALYHPSFSNPADDYHVVLTTHNAKADAINARELAALQGATHTYRATVEGEFPERNYPTEAILELKTGARVMFVKNDEEQPRRFYNGKTGVVEKLGTDSITIACEGDDSPIVLRPVLWRNVRYDMARDTRLITETELGTFRQFPLRPAWAITIHKSQGLTFDRVLVDAEAAFAAGQVYVALSRCRSLSGIVLMSRLRPSALQSDRRIVDFTARKTPPDRLSDMLAPAQTEYALRLFGSLYDFSAQQVEVEHIAAMTREHRQHITGLDERYLTALAAALGGLQSVGEAFVRQIAALRTDAARLQRRLADAAAYFGERIGGLLGEMKPPFATDNKALAREADELLGRLREDLWRKTAVMDAVGRQADTETYFRVKNAYSAPKWNQSVYAAVGAGEIEVHHPVLYRQLAAYCAARAKERGVPAYMVCPTRTLTGIANALPLNKKDLLRVKGFGKAKAEQYGDDLLEIVGRFCSENGLDGYAEALFQERERNDVKKEKPKRQKGDSWRQTYELYSRGLSLERIAEERQLALRTVAGHLFEAVRDGRLPFDELLPEEKFRQAQAVIADHEDDETRQNLLNDLLSPAEQVWLSVRLRNP